MQVLVAFASKHGSTTGIAERIARVLSDAGVQAVVRDVATVTSIDMYDACVIGSAAYMGGWMKPAAEFVRAHQAGLSSRPVWLFSSGPLGDELVDQHGRDKRELTVPREIAEFEALIHPRGHRVFFGALTPSTLTSAERMFRMIPFGRSLLQEGDFRDWDDIDAWSANIAGELAGALNVVTRDTTSLSPLTHTEISTS